MLLAGLHYGEGLSTQGLYKMRLEFLWLFYILIAVDFSSLYHRGEHTDTHSAEQALGS